MSSTAYKAPGRIGNPDLDLEHDPRTRPDLLTALKSMGLASNSVMDWAKTPEEQEQHCKVSHEGFSAVYEQLPNDLPGDASEPDVQQTEISIESFDGSKIKLYVYRAKGSDNVPAVLYIHGGGATILETTAKPHLRWLKSLALKGVVAIGVDFRNAWQPDGNHCQFPTGLNDCAAAVRYVHAHKKELGVSKIIIQGESGGANLTLATALKANREGWSDIIAGVYGAVPFISGAYGWPIERKLAELPSLVECDGYFLNIPGVDGMAQFYAPKEEDKTNPLAWPYFATEQDLRGLPPHLLSMDELDPLRDEGMAYYRKLLAAGVRVTAEVNLGIVHATSLIFRKAVPDVHEKAVERIVAFAKAV
ncbi:hypothetical protein M409DRAFT_26134 [Zasmidium cellare ATCC 36951]|uniref:Alpha/beta hydrolase fold-3 domain-containing protein n=1 Tax=Zasmidium cellare ATCC 36951 TaxID=1080233 RepID=A0A6A6C9M4_ZASCE|nr:uncharacterized protein M409DRAFT_26134 [Zasmidium cellare ATCC 36951]KAF2163523.1 hypothetical protein M409DRAFT_26134 [Zasmidium cellare ATCC 36951]